MHTVVLCLNPHPQGQQTPDPIGCSWSTAAFLTEHCPQPEKYLTQGYGPSLGMPVAKVWQMRSYKELAPCGTVLETYLHSRASHKLPGTSKANTFQTSFALAPILPSSLLHSVSPKGTSHKPFAQYSSSQNNLRQEGNNYLALPTIATHGNVEPLSDLAVQEKLELQIKCGTEIFHSIFLCWQIIQISEKTTAEVKPDTSMGQIQLTGHKFESSNPCIWNRFFLYLCQIGPPFV